MSATRSRPLLEILLVDDNLDGLIARRTVLTDLGHHVITTAHPADALGLVERTSFDLVVTDYKMPEMDGIELIRHLRQIRPSVRVILLSAFADLLPWSESSTGADAVIQKNAGEVTVLARTIDRLFNPKSARKPAGTLPPAKRARSRPA